MHRTNIGANQVPPGALVSFLQRGIQYVEMQSNLNEVSNPPMCDDTHTGLSSNTLWVAWGLDESPAEQDIYVQRWCSSGLPCTKFQCMAFLTG